MLVSATPSLLDVTNCADGKKSTDLDEYNVMTLYVCGF